MDKGQIFDKIKTLLEMIKFSHTIFAFPFALMGVVLAALASGKAPGVGQVFWICVAMVGARTAAMGLNRLIDAKIDAGNPRTADRHIPAGKVSIFEASLFILVALIIFFFAAWMLNPLCLKLAPVVVGFFVLYAYCKRFTHLAHVVLGLCLAAAPIGAWVALRGDLGWSVISLGIAVLFWVSGFDVFYALQDYDYDVEHGLHSVPSKLGKEKSFLLVRIFHGLMLVFLLLVLPGSGLGWIYFLGVVVVAGLLVYEHLLVKPDDLSRLNDNGSLYLSFMEGEKSGFEKTSFSDDDIFFNYYKLKAIKELLVDSLIEPVEILNEGYQEQDGSVTMDVFIFARKKQSR